MMSTHFKSQASSGSRPRGSLWRTITAVAWSFVGIRKNSDYQQDAGRLNPFHVIAVALAGMALFVGALALLVSWVVK